MGTRSTTVIFPRLSVPSIKAGGLSATPATHNAAVPHVSTIDVAQIGLPATSPIPQHQSPTDALLQSHYSPVDAAPLHGAVLQLGAGQTFTSGAAFAILAAQSVRGIKFYWPTNVGADVVRCKLWDRTSGTLLASVDVPVLATGVYTGLFATPIALSALGHEYAFSTWAVTSSGYLYQIKAFPAAPFRFAQNVRISTGFVYSITAIDGIPAGSALDSDTRGCCSELVL